MEWPLFLSPVSWLIPLFFDCLEWTGFVSCMWSSRGSFLWDISLTNLQETQFLLFLSLNNQEIHSMKVNEPQRCCTWKPFQCSPSQPRSRCKTTTAGIIRELYFENIGLHGNEGTSPNENPSVRLNLQECFKDGERLPGRQRRRHYYSGLKTDHTSAAAQEAIQLLRDHQRKNERLSHVVLHCWSFCSKKVFRKLKCPVYKLKGHIFSGTSVNRWKYGWTALPSEWSQFVSFSAWM